jgi:ABC-2 type transport system ATP-binding protein
MKLLAEVELTDKAKNQAKELSGGQRQRLSIAIGLVNDPKVLFLDEPTTGLDPQARRHLWDLVRAIKARGTTIVITTHYMDEAEVLCDRVGIMDHGKMIKLSTPKKLIEELLSTGFSKPVLQQQANLEDVFLNLTGHALRE